MCLCVFVCVCVYIYTERRESINLELLIEGLNFWPLLNVGKLQNNFFVVF